jgi:spoIIIJ-associated protein
MEKETDLLKIEEKLKKIIEELIEKMGFLCEVSVEKNEAEMENSYICNAKTEDSSFLIGQHGINLDSLQHIARIIVRKKLEEKINFALDINSYRKEKTSSIVNLAESMAGQAVREGRAVIMRPMSPYERRLVHMALSGNEKIKTESIGENDNRRIIIKPADLI